jgi:hypothetical protein
MGEEDRWTEATSALKAVLADPKNATLEFGFDSFPSAAGECGVDATVVVDCGKDLHTKISNELDNMSPQGSTPLCSAMERFLDPKTAPLFSDPEADSYLIIVSDGEDVCRDNTSAYCDFPAPDFETLTTDLLGQQAIKTYVIGFSFDAGTDGEFQLRDIAQNGGTGEWDYMTADNQAELQTRINGIAADVISCTYDIDEPNATADPDLVNFYFDGEVVMGNDGCASGDEGWTWTDDSHTQVEFCPDSCEELRQGNVSKVSARFGCATIVPV